MIHQGTSGLLELAEDLRATAPNVQDAFNLRKGAALMRQAAEALERLAPMEPDIDAVQGEN